MRWNVGFGPPLHPTHGHHKPSQQRYVASCLCVSSLRANSIPLPSQLRSGTSVCQVLQAFASDLYKNRSRCHLNVSQNDHVRQGREQGGRAFVGWTWRPEVLPLHSGFTSGSRFFHEELDTHLSTVADCCDLTRGPNSCVLSGPNRPRPRAQRRGSSSYWRTGVPTHFQSIHTDTRTSLSPTSCFLPGPCGQASSTHRSSTFPLPRRFSTADSIGFLPLAIPSCRTNAQNLRNSSPVAEEK